MQGKGGKWGKRPRPGAPGPPPRRCDCEPQWWGGPIDEEHFANVVLLSQDHIPGTAAIADTSRRTGLLLQSLLV